MIVVLLCITRKLLYQKSETRHPNLDDHLHKGQKRVLKEPEAVASHQEVSGAGDRSRTQNSVPR